MADRTPACAAGEPLELLEEALDRVRFDMEECGCIRVGGTLPPQLGDSLTRALITVEVEMLERGVFVRTLSVHHAGRGSIRITVGTADQNRRCVELLRQVLQMHEARPAPLPVVAYPLSDAE